MNNKMERYKHESLEKYINEKYENNLKINNIRDNIWNEEIKIPYFNSKNKVVYTDKLEQEIIKVIFVFKWMPFSVLKEIFGSVIKEDALARLLIRLSNINGNDFIFNIIFKDEITKNITKSNLVVENKSEEKQEITAEKRKEDKKEGKKEDKKPKKEIKPKAKKKKKSEPTAKKIMMNETIITLTTFTLKEIYKGIYEKVGQENIPESIDAYNAHKMRCIRLADNVRDKVLERLQWFWNSIPDKQNDYIKKLCARYITLNEYLLLDDEGKKEFITKIGFSDKDIITYIKNSKNMTETMRDKIVRKMLEAKMFNKENLKSVLGIKYFNDFRTLFLDAKLDSKAKYSLYYGLIEMDMKMNHFDYLQLIENAIRGLMLNNKDEKILINMNGKKDYAIYHNLLNYSNDKMLYTLKHFVDSIKAKNQVITKNEANINKEIELSKILNKIYCLTGCKKGLLNKKSSLDKKAEKNLLNQLDYDLLDSIVNDLDEIDLTISELKDEYREKGIGNKYIDSKEDMNKEEVEITNSVLTLNYLSRIKVFIENVRIKQKNDKYILVLDIASFDSCKGSISRRGIRKRVFGTTAWSSGFRVSGIDVKINFTLYYYEINQDFNYKSEYEFAIKDVQFDSKPDSFDTKCLYEYKETINDTLNRITEEIKMRKQ